MKKFLIAAAFIFSLMFAQFSQALAYTPQEGDKAIVSKYTCGWCFETFYEKSFYRNKQLIAEEKLPSPHYGCSNPHTNGEHYHPSSYQFYYIFTNGSWEQVTDY